MYYLGLKVDLLVGVVEKYILDREELEKKLEFRGGWLGEFMEEYIGGVERRMKKVGGVVDKSNG